MAFVWIWLAACASCQGAVAKDSGTCDPQTLDNRRSPEGFADAFNRSYLQLPGPEYGLRLGIRPFQENALAPEAVPLCLDRYAVVWASLRPGNDGYSDVKGLIVDTNLKPLGATFDISRGDTEYEPHITRLNAAQFLVLWEQIRTANGNARRVSVARVFDFSGRAESKEFQISENGENLNDVHARVLRNGRIVFAWFRYGRGVYFRIFDSTGRALIPETRVAASSQLGDEPISTITAVTQDGFSVFIRNDSFMGIEQPFSFGRAYDQTRAPRGPLIVGKSVSSLAGYQQAVEVVAASAARIVESDARQLMGDPSGTRYVKQLCTPQGAALLSNAIGISKFSLEKRIRTVAISYCSLWQSKCGLQEFLEGEHLACATASN